MSAESERGRRLKSDADDSPFCLLLKSERNVPLGPKSSLQIPVTFGPCEMRTYEVRCTVSLRREDGMPWDQLTSCQHRCVEPNGFVLSRLPNSSTDC